MTSQSGLRVSRRAFTRSALAAAALGVAPGFLRAKDSTNKLKIAMIGSGGRGKANIKGVATEDVIALCDVNQEGIDQAAAQYPKAEKFKDFRKLFDKANTFDAVMVSTCEHTHAIATLMAMKLGKHVYCEKPLTHNIAEARVIREEAAKTKVATQMGIQNHANPNYRRVVEIVQAGIIGPVREVHTWVNRSWGLQSKEDAIKFDRDQLYVTERPKPGAAIPAGLDWDLWIGPAPMRPFDPVYIPGYKWYRWWDFGNGTMSDLGSHSNDLPFWALKLRAPLTVEAHGPPPHPEIAPATMTATYEYGPRGDLPALTFQWYQGNVKPKRWAELGLQKFPDGTLFVGDKGMLVANYKTFKLLPEKAFEGVQLPAESLPRVASHYAEWIEACKTGKQPLANFEYSGWLTEANHLGNVAYRTGKKLEWDVEGLRARNAPEADRFIRREYRKGWSLA